GGGGWRLRGARTKRERPQGGAGGGTRRWPRRTPWTARSPRAGSRRGLWIKAAHSTVWTRRLCFGVRLAAARLNAVAARMERAARRSRQGVRDGPRNRFARQWHSNPRTRCQEAARVRMRGRSEESRCVRRLDDLAGIHDGHALTDLGDDAKIVRDEEEGEAECLPQPAQQNEDLELHGDVERRRGLVGDE